jgi:hypothetical protein
VCAGCCGRRADEGIRARRHLGSPRRRRRPHARPRPDEPAQHPRPRVARWTFGGVSRCV